MGGKLTKNYLPSIDEVFMNSRQLEFFRLKLLSWRTELLTDSRETLQQLQTESRKEPDLADRASTETDWSVELRTRDRERKLIGKIDAALGRIETGDYGFCEVTGDPISLNRLKARPIASMTVEAQEQHEKQEKVHRDD